MSAEQRILIVDDDEDARDFLRVVLMSAGYGVDEAEDGEQALRRTARELPDLILLDIVMPGMDGLDVCRRMREDPAYDDVPIVFLSARQKADDKIAGLEAGGVDYITKPFHAGEVLVRVSNQLRIKALTEALKRANASLVLKQQRIDEDLRAAALIQQSLLPREVPSFPGVEFAWLFRPSASIGGDIFNIIALDRSRIGMYLLDVSGHGISAALVAVSVSQALLPQSGLVTDGEAGPIVSPAVVLERLDALFPFERFHRHFTIVYAILDLDSGVLTYSAAGHPPAMAVGRAGTVTLLDRGGTFIGLGGIVPFDEGSVMVQPGDAVFFYTDGVTESQNAAEEMFGGERLQQVLSGASDLTLAATLSRMEDALKAHGGGAAQADDVSVLCFRYRGG